MASYRESSEGGFRTFCQEVVVVSYWIISKAPEATWYMKFANFPTKVVLWKWQP